MSSPSLLCAVEDVLQQGRLLLRTVNAELYALPLDGLPGTSIGGHYRHVLDHFQCLLVGLRGGEINYDQRRRDPQVERSLEYALEVTEQISAEFAAIPEESWRLDCAVIYSVGYDAPPETARTNAAREVMFCIGHAIHHYAILKLLCANLGVKLPYTFGVAPSTLKHLETSTAA